MEYMQLSHLELQILEQLSNGTNTIQEITKNLNRDQSRIYRAKQNLIQKEILQPTQKTLEPIKNIYIIHLLQLLSKYPNLIPLLADSGIPILITILEPKTIKDIEKQTTFKKSIIYQKIKEAKQISIINQFHKNHYQLNQKTWQDLATVLKEIQNHENTADPKIPANSTIYFKTPTELIFSNTQKIDATPTGFSQYTNYGIKILLPTNYYYLPKKHLTIQAIFTHSLHITQKEFTNQHLILIALFYTKHKNTLKNIHHPLLTNIQHILNGITIKGYPTIEEIKEKAEVYDIRL